MVNLTQLKVELQDDPAGRDIWPTSARSRTGDLLNAQSIRWLNRA